MEYNKFKEEAIYAVDLYEKDLKLYGKEHDREALCIRVVGSLITMYYAGQQDGINKMSENLKKINQK